MIEMDVDHQKSITLRKLMRRELLIASVIPMTAILVVGAIGAQQINTEHFTWFIVPTLLCATIAFLGERTLLLKMQAAIYAKLSEIALTCQECMEGDRDKRVWIEGEDDDFANLASVINALLDQNAVLQSEQDARRDLSGYENQLEQMVNQFKPVLGGDLRISLSTAEGQIGIIAGAVNALIETLVQYTRWTLYTSRQAIDNSRQISYHSLELAQMTKTHIQRLAQATKATEMLKSFLQRVNDTLQLTLATSQEVGVYLQQQSKLIAEFEQQKILSVDTGIYGRLSTKTDNQEIFPLPTNFGDYAFQSRGQLEKFRGDMQRQTRLLEAVLYSTRETATIADSVIEDLYFVAQQTHQLSTNILQTAEQSRAITLLAEDWRSAAEALQLPDEKA